MTTERFQALTGLAQRLAQALSPVCKLSIHFVTAQVLLAGHTGRLWSAHRAWGYPISILAILVQAVRKGPPAEVLDVVETDEVDLLPLPTPTKQTTTPRLQQLSTYTHTVLVLSKLTPPACYSYPGTTTASVLLSSVLLVLIHTCLCILTSH